ncbi:MAG: hypothetical protein OXE73_09335 [Gammaproteobacteria bacterium]|nr:hypothetical protein [Gammaproteobacteria bacterium]
MRRTGMKLAMALSLIMLCSACVSTGSSDGTRRDPDLILAEELADYSTMRLTDAIRQLRPRWMSVRGSATGSAVPVVMDGGVPQDWAILDSLRPDQVQSIRFHSAADATMRWGTGYPNGLIEVLTLRGRGGW